ncbi:MAG TPA: twin-arginine translocase subunit TatC [Dehalococcoidales bacterium]|nr:twin-arginine translocase subunit TatC [Dehalococcoidales bacterium]
MTILQHLEALRKSLVRSVIAVALTTSLSFVFWHQLMHILIRPIHGVSLIFVDMTEMIGTTFRVCLAGGIIIAIPYLTYEFIMFVSPALTGTEKRYVTVVLPWICLMFAGGVLFSYFVLLPPAMRFLTTFGSDIAAPQIRIGNYISIVTRLLIITGLIFELPVVTTLLAKIGIVSPRWLAQKRKWAIVLAFVLAAIITPTFDPINQSLVAVPLVILYEMSIWLAKVVYRKEARPVTLASPT